MLCVEFLQVQYINLSDVARVVKVVSIVTVSHFSLVKVSPEWKLNPAKVPLSSEQRCHFIRPNKYKDYMRTFFWRQILCPLNGGVPQRGGSTVLVHKER